MSMYSATTDLVLEHRFDPHTRRQTINGLSSVIHCHHYSTLYTQLALDAKETGLLTEAAEDTFYDMLQCYYQRHALTTLEARIESACQYYSALGLGLMQVHCLGDDSCEVELYTSHVDSGWLQKWGQHDVPVNYIGAGYIAALCAATLDLPAHSFRVKEVRSLVMGAPSSLFQAVKEIGYGNR
jgi:hypothetical protein